MIPDTGGFLARLKSVLPSASDELVQNPRTNRADSPDDAGPRLSVRVEVRPGTAYVGQAVDLVLDVIAGSERPRLTAPKVAGADLVLIGTEPETPSSQRDEASEMKRQVYQYQYRLTPRRPGVLSIPPFTARSGEASAASKPARLNVRSLPAAGRPAAFLGGVGGLELDASATPTTLQVGQVVEYRITIRGSSAVGVTAAPDLARLKDQPLGLEVVRGTDDEFIGNPPSRTFVFRLRPTRAGAATLPPIAIAAFDPESGKYLTKTTPGIALRVLDVPGLDPLGLEPGPPTGSGTSGLTPSAGTMTDFFLAFVAIAVGLVVVLARLVERRTPRSAARRLIRDILQRTDRAGDDAERARLASRGLADYLALTIARPKGVLTPSEAAAGVSSATGSDELAAGAGRLLAWCDEALYRGAGSGPESTIVEPQDALVRSFFLQLLESDRTVGFEHPSVLPERQPRLQR